MGPPTHSIKWISHSVVSNSQRTTLCSGHFESYHSSRPKLSASCCGCTRIGMLALVGTLESGYDEMQPPPEYSLQGNSG